MGGSGLDLLPKVRHLREAEDARLPSRTTFMSSAGHCAAQPRKVFLMKSNSVYNLALAAAFAGLLGGTSARLNAQTTGQNSTPSASAGLLLIAQNAPALPKHSCKGKNDCKGQGGGDAKHAGKNSCKGKGACATDGSKTPKV
jgi:hypothetical protein